MNYSQTLMDQCNQQTKDFQNEIKEHLDNVHKLHKSSLKNTDNIDNRKLPDFIKQMGYRKALNKKNSIIMPSNTQLKFHKMAKKLFFGLNKLYKHTKHNWENIMNRF